jgi:uncharacterized protein with von Willebrand factor type A (vWA) domain
MIRGLNRFAAELRRSGIHHSPAEWLDALRAIECVGLADRTRFRDALRATLVKRWSQRPRFDAAFDAFFKSPGTGKGDAYDSGAAGTADRGAAKGESSSRSPAARPSADRRTGSERVPGRPTEASAAAAPGDERVPRTGQRRPRADAVARMLTEVRDASPSRRGRLRHVALSRESRDSPERPTARSGLPHPARTDLRRPLPVDDERRVAEQVRRCVEQIRLRGSRRRRRAPAGRLYLRNVFRENLRHGGVPFVLPRRRTARRSARVVLLIDVSWSTTRAAALFLSIAAEFLRTCRSVRTLLFVDRPVDATPAVERWMRSSPSRARARPTGRRPPPGSTVARGGASFVTLLDGVRGLDPFAASDYGRMFHRLLGSPLRPQGRDTVLVVLGDGRTNRYDAQDWAFEEIAEHCGSTIWLVPEALEEWGTGDSALDVYLPHADVAVETADLAGLARGVAELMRRI